MHQLEDKDWKNRIKKIPSSLQENNFKYSDIDKLK